MQLAELNIGRLIAPPGDARVAPFFEALDEINALAEASPGFVWRLVGEGNNATDLGWDLSDPRLIPNLSVWETVESLHAYVYRTAHSGFLRQRGDWFAPLGAPHFVMWWVETGHKPDLSEALERLERLRNTGPGKDAFDFPYALKASKP